jgi:hypothetical protein
MEYNSWFAGVVIMLLDWVHRVSGRCAALVNTGNSAVTDSTAIVPRYGGAGGNRLERWRFRGRHWSFLMVDSASTSISAETMASAVGVICPTVIIISISQSKVSRYFGFPARSPQKCATFITPLQAWSIEVRHESVWRDGEMQVFVMWIICKHLNFLRD